MPTLGCESVFSEKGTEVPKTESDCRTEITESESHINILKVRQLFSSTVTYSELKVKCAKVQGHNVTQASVRKANGSHIRNE